MSLNDELSAEEQAVWRRLCAAVPNAGLRSALMAWVNAQAATGDAVNPRVEDVQLLAAFVIATEPDPLKWRFGNGVA